MRVCSAIALVGFAMTRMVPLPAGLSLRLPGERYGWIKSGGKGGGDCGIPEGHPLIIRFSPGDLYRD